MRSIKKRLQNSIWTVAGVGIYTLALSVVTYILHLERMLPREITGFTLTHTESLAELHNGINILLQTTLLWITSIMIRYLEESNNLYRKKSIFSLAIPPLIFVGSGSWHVYSPVSIFALLFVLIFLFILKEYKSTKPERTIFYLSLTLSTISIIDVDFLYLAPWLWIMMGSLKILKIRTIALSLLGLSIAYLYYMIGDYWIHGSLTATQQHFSELISNNERTLRDQHWLDQIYWSILTLMTLVAIINFFKYAYKERQKVRVSIIMVCWGWVTSIVMLVVKCGKYAYVESLMMVTSAILISHYFSVANDRLSKTLFYLFTTVLFSYPILRIIWNT